jgi:hypothetical protein
MIQSSIEFLRVIAARVSCRSIQTRGRVRPAQPSSGGGQATATTSFCELLGGLLPNVWRFLRIVPEADFLDLMESFRWDEPDEVILVLHREISFPMIWKPTD